MPAVDTCHHQNDPPQDDYRLTRAERAEQTASLLSELAHTHSPDDARRLRERVILVNRRVADAVAARYDNRGVPREDLKQVAYEALTKAVDRFDPALRNDFLTYAVPTIRGELQRYFRDRGWTVRPPRRVQETQWRASQVTDLLEHRLGREPNAGEVAEEVGVTVKQYNDAMAASGCFNPVSLDAPTGHGDLSSIGDLLCGSEPHGQYDTVEAKATITPAMLRLPVRDRRILYLRFFEDQTQEQIGRDLGVTQMQVSRLLARILATLRTELQEPA